MEAKVIVNSAFQSRIEQENKIFKILNREILKSAKRGDKHYYWDIIGLSDYMVKSIISRLEEEGRTVTSKGINFKVIHW